MHKLMEKTCDALDKIKDSGDLNLMDNADRKLVSELVDLKKNILKVEKLEEEMEDGGYSSRGGQGGYSRANRGQHYVRGHYSRDGGSSYDDGDGGYSSRRGGGRGSRGGLGGYSRDDGRSEMMEHLEMALDSADDQDRETIKRFMREIEKA